MLTPEFLQQIADAHCLSSDEREAFLARFKEQNLRKNESEVATELMIGEPTLKNKLTDVYNKLADSCPDLKSDKKGKFKALEAWLQEKQRSQREINWREVCDAMLNDQQEKQRFRRQATEMGFEVDADPVELCLLKRKKQQRRDEKVEGERVYELDENAIAKTYKHKDFLLEVIGNSKTKENSNIAIIGEPGAGKTTLLSAIASFIQSETQQFPICISLASLEGKSLEDYLSKTWLPKALGLVNPEINNVETLHITSLRNRFRQGGVWLLLDGVDEMGISSPTQALETIQKELTDWIGQARVVLTCRLNVWDAQIKPTLTGFDTYRLQQFNSEDIDKFITDWFNKAGKEQLGKQLQAKLKEPGKERICELVKHPLRLALLCQIFYRNEQAELPETKAGLYQLFTRYFYEWKSNLSQVDDTTKAKLHQDLGNALGNLALAGINSNTRFRLKKSFACQKMGEELFTRACDLGWLNIVDRDANDDEEVYAFFHPTFQEYFAALAIDNWHYFLKHILYNPAGGTYRLFEPQWKEVFLLWMGRSDINTKNKEELINDLINFEDGCDDSKIGHYQAYLLAASSLQEFGSDKTNKIISQILKWSMLDADDYIIQYHNLSFLSNPLAEEAREVLQELRYRYCSRIINAVQEFLKPILRESIRLQAVVILIQLEPTHSAIIPTLIDIIKISQDNLIRANAIGWLGDVGINNLNAINFLRGLIDQVWRSKNNGDVFYTAFIALVNISINCTEITEYLQNILGNLLNSTTSGFRSRAIYILEQISEHNPDAFNRISCWEEHDFTALTHSEEAIVVVDDGSHDLWEAEELLEDYLSDPEAILNSSSEFVGLNAITALLKSDPSDLRVFDRLLEITRNSTELNFIEEIISKLREILNANQFDVAVVSKLKNCLPSEYSNEILWYCFQNMSYPEFYQAWHGIDPNVEAFTNQFSDINALLNKLQRTDQTYPIAVNASVLETETDNSLIAQALCNRIYQATSPDNPETIPEVNNVFQLERSLLKLKHQLQKQNLALIIYSCEPQPALINFCRQLIDVVHIAWITNQPIEAPLRGFPPDQPHLINALQSWINRIEEG